MGDVFSRSEWTAAYPSVAWSPWGWSPALVHTLRQEEVDEVYLPSAGILADIRALSGRTSAVPILQSFAGMKGICGEACACFTLEEVRTIVAGWGRFVLKSSMVGKWTRIGFCFQRNLDSFSRRLDCPYPSYTRGGYGRTYI